MCGVSADQLRARSIPAISLMMGTRRDGDGLEDSAWFTSVAVLNDLIRICSPRHICSRQRSAQYRHTRAQFLRAAKLVLDRGRGELKLSKMAGKSSTGILPPVASVVLAQVEDEYNALRKTTVQDVLL